MKRVAEHPLYSKVKFSPQLGLIPLGRMLRVDSKSSCTGKPTPGRYRHGAMMAECMSVMTPASSSS